MEQTHVLADSAEVLTILEKNNSNQAASLILRHLTDAPKISLDPLHIHMNAIESARQKELDPSHSAAFVLGYETLARQLREKK